MGLPQSLKKISEFLQKLPGIGEKTANRLSFYFLRIPQKDLEEFGKSIIELRKKTKYCHQCLNLTEGKYCSICSDTSRDQGIITVVESPLDIIAFEQGRIYTGVYHVLHGRIDPLNNIRPEDIFIDKLLKRVYEDGKKIKEIILAMNPDMEGEATAMYIRDRLKEIKSKKGFKFRVTRLGYGLPIGASLEYTDYFTLKKAIESRTQY